MATTSPGDLKKEGEELKALFAKVKKKQHNCAVLKSKDGLVIEVHIKKSPEVLLKAAKKAGGMPKGVWGTMTMDGQVIIVDPINDKIPGNLTKLAKKFFSERGMKFRLEIKEPEEGGASTGSDEEETTEEEQSEEEASEEEEESSTKASEAENEEPASEEDIDPKQKLIDQLAKIQNQIDALLADKENVMHSELVDSLRSHERVMEEGEFDRAVDTLRRIEVALEDYAAILAKTLPLQKRFDDLAAAIEKVKSAGDEIAVEEVTAAEGSFKFDLSHREFDSAKLLLDKIEEISGRDFDADQSQSEENPELRALKERFDKVSDQVDALKADSENVMHEPLAEALRDYHSRLESEKYDFAMDYMIKIESVLKDYADLLAQAAPLNKRMEEMAKDLERIKKSTDHEAADAAATAESGFDRAMRTREWGTAAEHLDNLQKTIEGYHPQDAEQTDDEESRDESSGQESEAEATRPSQSDEDTDEDTSDEVDPAVEKAELVKRFAKIKDDLGNLLKSGAADQAKNAREKAIAFAAEIKAEDFAAAQHSIDDLEQLVKETTSSPEKSARMSRIAEMKKGLGSLLKELS